MMGDVRLRRHPTHHPLGACLAAAGAVCANTGGATPLEAAVWSDAARRCVSAIETRTALDTEGFTASSASAETDSGWPKLEIFAGPAGVGVVQQTRRKVENGMVSVLTSTKANPRGCHMTIEFLIDLDRSAATVETKERPGAECGGGELEQ